MTQDNGPLGEIAGNLSTQNFEHLHPQKALAWLIDHADALRAALKQPEAQGVDEEEEPRPFDFLAMREQWKEGVSTAAGSVNFDYEGKPYHMNTGIK